MQDVLVTGFPSFISRMVLRELLSEDVRIHLIVRERALDQAREQIAELERGASRKIEVLTGDPSSIDLGLSGKEFGELAKHVVRIYHLAEMTLPTATREVAFQQNVHGVREVLELASACTQLELLVHLSSAHVAGMRRGRILEAELSAGQTFRNPIEETKARGERMMREAMARLPIAVVRPSMIVGSSETGEIDRFDGPYLLILLMMTSPPDLALPLPGKGDSRLNLVPIDHVVRAIAAIGRDKTAAGKTFHVVDPDPLSARQVFQLIAEATGRRSPRGFISANLTKAILRTPGIERFARSPRVFLDALGAQVTFDQTNAQELLGRAGVHCPPFNSYVDKIVGYVEEQLRTRKERGGEGGLDVVADPLA